MSLTFAQQNMFSIFKFVHAEMAAMPVTPVIARFRSTRAVHVDRGEMSLTFAQQNMFSFFNFVHAEMAAMS
jgi:hypothetical protein